MSPSSNIKAENIPLKSSTFISLLAFNVSEMDENISEKPQISFLKKVEKLKRYYFHSNR
jgi:hypothetical protein